MEEGEKAREVKGLKGGGKGEKEKRGKEENHERVGRGSKNPLGHLSSVDRTPSPC